MCPLEKGVRGIETSGAGYLRQQISGGRKGRAEHRGLGQRHKIAKKSDRSAIRASSDAEPELAGREGHAAMESPQALIAPLERGSGRLKRNARSVRGWDRVPMKKQDHGGKSPLGQHCCPIAAFYRGSMWRNLQVVINQAFKQNQSYGFGNSESTYSIDY